MYEPKQTEIDDKVAELLDKALVDDDVLIDAVISCMPQLRALLSADFSNHSDTKLDLETAIKSYIVGYLGLEEKATDALIAEVGYVKQVDVDNFEFVAHERDAEC